MTEPAAKILVADDSSTERNHARDALEAAGYEVLQAMDGQQALELYARERPDLVMLDVVMPRLTGLETCRILKAKAQGSYLPVIMVSTRNSVNARVEGLRSGADDYLGKPYDPEELRARVEVLLRTRRALTEKSSEVSRTTMLVGTPSNADLEERRTAFEQRLSDEFDRAERYSDPLACLRVQLDQFNDVRERAGDDAAAHAVLQLRDIIENSVRKIDLVFRMDAMGFVVILPNTHFPGALAVAERISIDGARMRTDASTGPSLSCSIGVSFYPNKDTHSVQDLLDLVKAALDRALSEGGGKICLYQHQGYLYRPQA